MTDKVDSTSDARTVNNGPDTVRHNYRTLNDQEKANMVAVKAKGKEFLDLLETLKPTRENSLAKTKVEEAVMWAVKSLTK